MDPIGFAAGDVNWYSYVANCPIGNLDPDGLAKVFPQTHPSLFPQPIPFNPSDPVVLKENLEDRVPRLGGEIPDGIIPPLWGNPPFNGDTFQNCLQLLSWMTATTLSIQNRIEDQKNFVNGLIIDRKCGGKDKEKGFINHLVRIAKEVNLLYALTYDFVLNCKYCPESKALDRFFPQGQGLTSLTDAAYNSIVDFFNLAYPPPIIQLQPPRFPVPTAPPVPSNGSTPLPPVDRDLPPTRYVPYPNRLPNSVPPPVPPPIPPSVPTRPGRLVPQRR
jgi:hypothetical protein